MRRVKHNNKEILKSIKEARLVREKEEHKRALTQVGKLKPKYQDLPRYDVIKEYEKEFKDSFSKELKEMTLNIGKTLKTMLK